LHCHSLLPSTWPGRSSSCVCWLLRRLPGLCSSFPLFRGHLSPLYPAASLMVCVEQAMLFNAIHGEIPERACRIWDNEMQTLHTAGKWLPTPLRRRLRHHVPLCFDSKRRKTVAASRVTGVGWDFLLGWLQSHALAIKLGRALRPTEGDSGVFSS
jgi:hypothetical protein